MKRYIPISRAAGTASRQAHADMPDGTYEREMSKEGFFGPAAFFHHRRPPTGWTSFEGPLQPRAYELAKLASGPTSPWSAHEVLANAACRIRWWRLAQTMPGLARNADGDELLFVHAGRGTLYCDFGRLEIEPGDYVVVPRGTMWRIECAAPMDLLLVEATNSSYMLPDKGLVGNHAIFDPALLDVPAIDQAFLAQQSAPGPWVVEVKRRNQLSRITYDWNPLDAVGWHGELSVVRINVRHFRPLMSHRYHLPPSASKCFIKPPGRPQPEAGRRT